MAVKQWQLDFSGEQLQPRKARFLSGSQDIWTFVFLLIAQLEASSPRFPVLQDLHDVHVTIFGIRVSPNPAFIRFPSNTRYRSDF